MKFLMVPEINWRAGGVQMFRCPACSGERVHVDLFPQTAELRAIPALGSAVVLLVAEHASRSGLTWSGYKGAYGRPVILGYGNHRTLVNVTEFGGIAPAELQENGIRCQTTESHATIAAGRFDWTGRKTEWVILGRDAYIAAEGGEGYPDRLILPVSERRCPKCLARAIEEAPDAVHQGHLILAPRQGEDFPELSGFGEGFRPLQGGQFFNHAPGAGEWSTRGRFLIGFTGEPTAWAATDHETVEIPAGHWVGYHPWPQPDRGLD